MFKPMKKPKPVPVHDLPLPLPLPGGETTNTPAAPEQAAIFPIGGRYSEMSEAHRLEMEQIIAELTRDAGMFPPGPLPAEIGARLIECARRQIRTQAYEAFGNLVAVRLVNDPSFPGWINQADAHSKTGTRMLMQGLISQLEGLNKLNPLPRHVRLKPSSVWKPSWFAAHVPLLIQHLAYTQSPWWASNWTVQMPWEVLAQLEAVSPGIAAQIEVSNTEEMLSAIEQSNLEAAMLFRLVLHPGMAISGMVGPRAELILRRTSGSWNHQAREQFIEVNTEINVALAAMITASMPTAEIQTLRWNNKSAAEITIDVIRMINDAGARYVGGAHRVLSDTIMALGGPLPEPTPAPAPKAGPVKKKSKS